MNLGAYDSPRGYGVNRLLAENHVPTGDPFYAVRRRSGGAILARYRTHGEAWQEKTRLDAATGEPHTVQKLA